MDSNTENRKGATGTTGALANVKSVYSLWGRFPTLYAAQDFVTFMGRPRHIRSRAIAKLHLRKGDRALDVACGTGQNFSYLVEAIGRDGRLVGFDYSQEMLDAAGRLCRRHGWKNIALIEGDAAELDIGDGGFDAALSTLGISAIPEYERALARCKEVLRPGGVLSVCDARLFGGRLRALNPLVRTVYRRWAAWDPSKDIPATMREVFGNVNVEDLNLGTIFIATSIKGEV